MTTYINPEVLAHPDLTPSDKALYALLATQVDGQGGAVTTAARLGVPLGLSERAIRACAQHLVRAGALVIEKRSPKPALYRLTDGRDS